MEIKIQVGIHDHRLLNENIMDIAVIYLHYIQQCEGTIHFSLAMFLQKITSIDQLFFLHTSKTTALPIIIEDGKEILTLILKLRN